LHLSGLYIFMKLSFPIEDYESIKISS